MATNADLGIARKTSDTAQAHLTAMLGEGEALPEPQAGMEAERAAALAAQAAARGRVGAAAARVAAAEAYRRAVRRGTVYRRAARIAKVALDALAVVDAEWRAARADNAGAVGAFNAVAPDPHFRRWWCSAPDPRLVIAEVPGVAVSAGTSKYTQGKGWRADAPATATVTVCADWADTVEAAGLAVCDGIMTLSAVAVVAPAGYSAWQAQWVAWGRGYATSVEAGIIVREDGRVPQTAHALTVAAGVAVLRRRARVQAGQAAAQAADLDACPGLHVTLHDARRSGACDPGIMAWCARAGIDPAAGATVAEIRAALAAGAGQGDMAERACRQAIGRQFARVA